jgi:hypothetical protein
MSDFEKLPTFESGEQYRDWVRAWKEEYKNLVTEIRATKAELRNPANHQHYRVETSWGGYMATKASGLMGTRHGQKRRARHLLELRRDGKLARPPFVPRVKV